MGERRVVFVTGGARRVGRAVVLQFARAGFDVVFSIRRASPDAERTADEARQGGADVAVLEADLRDTPADRIAANVLGAFGRLDVLINNAAVFKPDDTPEGPSLAVQREAFEVNCAAPVSLMREFAPALRAARGSVVNFIDLLADRPWPDYSAYCASKAALHTQTLAYARRLAPEVRVNGIAPGVIDWPEDMSDEHRAAYLKRVPLARAGTPDEAAKTALWLAACAPYVTGQVIKLDGGRSLV